MVNSADGSINLFNSQTHIMGILNVTPDSFSDGGNYMSLEAALHRAKEMIAEGASIIDIGGESTRPGAVAVPLEQELERVIPIIQAIRQESDVFISIDTYKSEVARQAIDAGANIINDVWGGIADPMIWEVVRHYQCPYILTHNRDKDIYTDFLTEVIDDLNRSLEAILLKGIRKEQIILDPGIGFAKSINENLVLMNHLEHIIALGYPVLLGTSRKRFIRHTLGLSTEEVLEGTAATVAVGVYKGCKIVRVHDVRAMKLVAKMTEAMRDSKIN